MTQRGHKLRRIRRLLGGTLPVTGVTRVRRPMAQPSTPHTGPIRTDARSSSAMTGAAESGAATTGAAAAPGGATPPPPGREDDHRDGLTDGLRAGDQGRPRTAGRFGSYRGVHRREAA
ncbi:hypothetical protein JCM9534A_42650 [Catenuloplanes indicus JCM 9534]|uniref:Uncharacterized protein n=1 Tax=Catenuloplanes indicus TaxID=137267 RepID=A0AAE3W187_9ACTN|nr:hypothetical protein [Catenuloplanes indicus]